MKFLFITSSNIACNPRLLKELQLAIQLGKSCTVIQFKLGNWTDSKTNQLKKSLQNVQFIEFSALRTPFYKWLYTSLIEKALSILPTKLLSIRLQAFSLSKRTIIIHSFLKGHMEKYDWVIAHNPPTFYPAFKFSSRMGVNLGFDIEDYHPGESNDPIKSERMLRMMKQLLPEANYCSFAAPLIQMAVENNINCNLQNSITLLNGFKESEFKFQQLRNQALKVIWYSQNIDFGRGLELFIDAAQSFFGQITITLIGELNPQFWRDYLCTKNYVNIIDPMNQVELNLSLSNYDIGLASDILINYNREIAVTNKIISYGQAGIWILATNTIGQIDFLKTYSLESTIVKYDLETIKSAFTNLLKKKDEIHSIRKVQYQKGRNISWEKISGPLVQIWN